jgi:RimJ/RimL family protein N-acetyltransferase
MQPDSLPNDAPILNLVGEKVALGPRRRDLVPLYHRWINDLEVTRTCAWGVSVQTREAMEEWYDRASKGGFDFVDFTIYEQSTLRPIGWTSLEEIDYLDRTAKFIILIGEKECWGKGYGTETARLILDYGFTVLGLHNVWLTVNSFNERGIRAYRRAGFREIGRRREAHRLAGQAFDVICMDCLASEFQSPLLHRLLPHD